MCLVLCGLPTNEVLEYHQDFLDDSLGVYYASPELHLLELQMGYDHTPEICHLPEVGLSQLTILALPIFYYEALQELLAESHRHKRLT